MSEATGGSASSAAAAKRAARAEAQRRRRQNPEVRAAEAEARRRRRQDSAVLAALAEVHRRRRADPRVRAAEAEAKRRRRQDPAVRAADAEDHRLRREDPRVRAAEAERKRRRRADPAVRAAEAEARRKERLTKDSATKDSPFWSVCSVCDRLWCQNDLESPPDRCHETLQRALPNSDMLCSTCSTECVRRLRDAETDEAPAAAKRARVPSGTEEQRQARCAESAGRRRARNAELLDSGATAKSPHRESARRRADPQVIAQHRLYAQIRKAHAAAARARRQAQEEAKLGLQTPHAMPTGSSASPNPAVASHQDPWAAPCQHTVSAQASVELLKRSVVDGVHHGPSVPTEASPLQAAEEVQMLWFEEDEGAESEGSNKSDNDTISDYTEQEQDDTTEVELRQHWAEQ